MLEKTIQSKIIKFITEQGEQVTKEESNEQEKAKAGTEQNLRSSAGIRPHDVDDSKSSLEDRLRNGFMAAYLNRVGEETNDTVEIN